MKNLNFLGLAAVAATALMAFVGAGTASATTLTGVGGSVIKTGSTIHAKLEGVSTLTTSFKRIECDKSTISGKTTNETGTTVDVNVETLTFSECTCEVKVLKGGTLAISNGGGGTVSSSGAEVTTSCSTVFGAVHCIYATQFTPLGALSGGTTARIIIGANSIPRLSTNALCDEIASWDADYRVDNPDTLNVIN